MKRLLTFCLFLAFALVACNTNTQPEKDPFEALKELKAKTIAPANGVVLEYEILDKNEHISKQYYTCDILIKDVDSIHQSSNEKLNAYLVLIKDDSNCREAYFYTTKQAQKANYSSSYANKNPSALNKGYLGKMDKSSWHLERNHAYFQQ